MSQRLDYVNREVASILGQIKENLRQDLPDVNDFLESSEGRFLLDAWAGVADQVGYTIDFNAAEAYIDLVKTRPNMLSLLKLIGFDSFNPVAEVVDVTFKIEPRDTSVLIPVYTRVNAVVSGRRSVGDAVIPFVTSVARYIDPGFSETTIPCVQGVWVPNLYTSNGSPYQTFILRSKSIAHHQVLAFVNGAEWFPAEDNTFVGHSPTDTVFRVQNLPDKRVLVEFGDGTEGAIPTKGVPIRLMYLDTLGQSGHVYAGEITQPGSSIGADYACNNDSPSTGGSDYETIDSARARYPSAFKTQRRAVTLEDWESLAKLVPGVMQTKAVDLNVDKNLPFFEVRLYVIGNGGDISDALNKKVYEYLKVRRVNATVFTVRSPEPHNVDLKGSITVYRRFDQQQVLSDVIGAANDFFVMTAEPDSEVQIGKDVYFSRLIAALQDVPGVAHVNLSSPLLDILVKPYEFAKLRTVDLTVSAEV